MTHRPHLIAMPDKFRGTATAAQAAAAMGRAADRADWTWETLPMSDGGEGLLESFGGANQTSRVAGPLDHRVDAAWRLEHRTAMIEMAAASGMSLVGTDNRPLDAHTRGTGQLIAHAIRAGADRVIVGAGGSATTDGGRGAVDELQRLAPLDGSRGYRVDVAVDVQTRFLDAARIFGPQKGANPDQVEQLSARLRDCAEHYESRFGVDVRDVNGGGAAGGLAGGLVALGAHLTTGFDLVADHLQLDARLKAADLVVTGEGRLDRSSLLGKGPLALAERCRTLGVTVAVVAGIMADDLDVDVPVIALVTRYGRDVALHQTEQGIEDATYLLLTGAGAHQQSGGTGATPNSPASTAPARPQAASEIT